jgi:hypothetical protein
MTEAEMFEWLRIFMLWEQASWTGNFKLPADAYHGPIEIRVSGDPNTPAEYTWTQEAAEPWIEDDEAAYRLLRAWAREK